MINLKKTAAVVMSAAMLMSLAACGGKSSSTKIKPVEIDDVAKALEDAGLEELTWDDYWWEEGTFCYKEENELDGTGADGNSYNFKVFENDEDAREEYDRNTSYIISMAEEYDVDMDKVDKDDYAYLIMTEEDEAIAYYYAGNCCLAITADNVDEANEVLSSIGWPEL